MRNLLALILLAGAVPARADIFTIALPGLHGLYDIATQAGSSKTTAFQLPGPPVVVRGATLHLVGTAEIGTLRCGGQGEFVYPWHTHTLGQMLDGSGKYWLSEAVNPDTAGAFDTIAAFEGLSSPTWSFLSDGQGEITLFGGTDIVLLGGCTTSWPPPTFTVTGAWILVDADIPTPTAAKSWGAVKAFYR
jgi:hypothetical protein